MTELLLQLFQFEYIPLIAGGFAGCVGGVFTAWFTQRALNRRGVFSYSVTHNRVGVSSEDMVFGKVTVTWNENEVKNLYLSTIEMKNESFNDYEHVIVRAYTSDTLLMNEQTQIVETPNPLELSDRYKAQIFVKDGEVHSANQVALYSGQREYIIPVFNRGQSIRITYLNSANTLAMPNIWLSVAIKGVKLKFQAPQNQTLGVPQNQAAFIGVLIGIVILVALPMFITDSLVIAMCAMSYGFIAQLPGAFTIRLYRRIKENIGG